MSNVYKISERIYRQLPNILGKRSDEMLRMILAGFEKSDHRNGIYRIESCGLYDLFMYDVRNKDMTYTTTLEVSGSIKPLSKGIIDITDSDIEIPRDVVVSSLDVRHREFIDLNTLKKISKKISQGLALEYNDPDTWEYILNGLGDPETLDTEEFVKQYVSLINEKYTGNIPIVRVSKADFVKRFSGIQERTRESMA